MLALLLHIYSTVTAVCELAPSRTSSWVTRVILRYRKRDASSEALQTARSFASILDSLADHAWINAIAWDVIFSVAGLSLWAGVSSADVRSILKCTLWPWLDETVELVQEGVGNLQDTAGPYVDSAYDGAQQFMTAAEPYTGAAARRAAELKGAADPYLDAAYRSTGLAAQRLKEQTQALVDSAAEAVQGNGFVDDDAKFYRLTGIPPEDLPRIYQWIVDCGRLSVADATIQMTDHVLNSTQAMGREGRWLHQWVAKHAPTEKTRGRVQDVADDEDWDDSATARKKSKSPKKRGGRVTKKDRLASERPAPKKKTAASNSRTRASEQEVEDTATRRRRSSRIKKLTDEASSGAGAVATIRERRKSLVGAVGGVVSRMEMPDQLGERLEAPGLTFGLFCIGGLGLASTGVFGADEI